jgi:hypothetical protein
MGGDGRSTKYAPRRSSIPRNIRSNFRMSHPAAFTRQRRIVLQVSIAAAGRFEKRCHCRRVIVPLRLNFA